MIARLDIIRKLENYGIAAMSKKSDPVLQFLDTSTTEIARRVVLTQKRKALHCRKSKVEIEICAYLHNHNAPMHYNQIEIRAVSAFNHNARW